MHFHRAPEGRADRPNHQPPPKSRRRRDRAACVRQAALCEPDLLHCEGHKSLPSFRSHGGSPAAFFQHCNSDVSAMSAACFQGRMALGRAHTFITYEPKATLQRQRQPLRQPAPTPQPVARCSPEAELPPERLQQFERRQAATASAAMLDGPERGLTASPSSVPESGTIFCFLPGWLLGTDHEGAGTPDGRDVSDPLHLSPPPLSDDPFVPATSVELPAWGCVGNAVAPAGARSFDDSSHDLPSDSLYQGSPSCHRGQSDSGSSPARNDGQRDLTADPHAVSSPDVPAASAEPGSFRGDWGDLTVANDLASGLIDSDELAWVHPPTPLPAGWAASNLSTHSSLRSTTPGAEVGQEGLEGTTTPTQSFQADRADGGKADGLLRANLRTVAPGTAFVALVIASPDSGSIRPLEHLQNVTPLQQQAAATVQDWTVEMLAPGTWLLTGFLHDASPSTRQDQVLTGTPQLEGSARSWRTARARPRKRPRRTIGRRSSPERAGDSCSDSDYDDTSDASADTAYAKPRKREKWTPLEDERLLAYRAEGMKWPWIHRQFPNHPPGSVTTHWYNLKDRKRRPQRVPNGIVSDDPGGALPRFALQGGGNGASFTRVSVCGYQDIVG